MSISRAMSSGQLRTFNPDEMKTKFWSLTCKQGLKYVELVKKKYCVTLAVLDPSSSKEEDLGKLVTVMIQCGSENHVIAVLKHGEIYQVPVNLFFDREHVTFYIKGNGAVELLGYEIINLEDTEKNEYARQNNEVPNDITVKQQVSKGDKKASSLTDVCMPSTSKDRSLNVPELEAMHNFNYENKPPGRKKKSRSLTQESSEDEEHIRKLKLSLLGDNDLDDESSSDDEDFDVENACADSSDENIEYAESNEEEDVDNLLQEDDDEDEDDVDEEEEEDDSEDEPKDMDEEDYIEKSSKSEIDEEPNHPQIPLKRKKSASDEVMPKKRSKLDETAKKAAKASKNRGNGSASDSFEKRLSIEKNGLNMSNLENQGYVNVGPVRIKDMRVGHGPTATKGKTISVFYVGRFVDSKIFDSVLPNKKPFVFSLGSNKMVKGFELGIEGMKSGGKRKIIVPPKLGYGNKAFNGKNGISVPPNSTLYFTVELMNVCL